MTKAHVVQHTTTQVVAQMATNIKNRMRIRSDNFFGRFVRLSVIKNQMTLTAHNTSAKWDATRSENLTKTRLTTIILNILINCNLVQSWILGSQLFARLKVD